METINAMPVITSGLTKTEISALASLSVDSVLEQGNPFQVAEALSSMEEFVKLVRKDQRFTDYLREELIKNNGKLTTVSGAKIEVAETGTAYDFSQCGDIELARLQWEFETAENNLKARKEFLKTVPAKGLVVTDPDSGETTTIYPPSKSSKSSYKITLAK